MLAQTDADTYRRIDNVLAVGVQESSPGVWSLWIVPATGGSAVTLKQYSAEPDARAALALIAGIAGHIEL